MRNGPSGVILTCGAALFLAASALLAQQGPPPPQPAVVLPLRLPPSAPPPQAPVPSIASTSQQALTAAALEPMKAVAPPVDSARMRPGYVVPAKLLVRPEPPAPRLNLAPRASAQVVEAPTAPPSGATMRCKDGSYLTGRPSADRCDGNAGVAVIFPAAPVSPPTPARRP